MTTLPATGYLSNTARTEGEMMQGLEALRDVIAELVGGSGSTTLTIGGGAITPVLSTHFVDTEGAAATDDLEVIQQTSVPDGRYLFLRSNDDARTVIVKHGFGGTGQILLATGADFDLNSTTKWLLLRREGAAWEEVGRFHGNDAASARSNLGLGAAALLGVGPGSGLDADTVDGAHASDLANSNLIPSGTSMLFAQANAPTGWTQDVSQNDRVLRLVSGAGGGVGGSWTLGGITIGGHAITASEIPTHYHFIATSVYVPNNGAVVTSANSATYKFGDQTDAAYELRTDGTTNANRGRTSTVGSGQAHSHGVSHDGSWRPAFKDVIIAVKE